MKRILLLAVALVVCAAPAMALNIKTSKHNLGATGNSAYTSYAGDATKQTTQICIFCHTPHNAGTAVPLWNRDNPTGSTFKLYTNSASLNIASGDRNGISSDSISLFCMSCHDGTAGTLAGRVRNRAAETLKNGGKDTNGNLRGYARIGDITGGSGSVTTDLTQDHPVNFSYDAVAGGTRDYTGATAGSAAGTASDRGGRDNDIRVRSAMTPAGGGSGTFTGGGLKFFKSTKNSNGDAYIECATCHDPHGTENPNMPGNRVKKFLRKHNDSSSLCLTCHIK